MIIYRALLSGLVFLLFTSYQPQTDNEKEKVLGQVIQQAILQGHFLPIQFNEEYSERAFQLYLKRIDIRKQFLTQQDVAELSKYKREIAYQVTAGKYELLDQASRILNERKNDTRAFYKEILEKPFNFNIKEYIEVDPEKLPFAKDKLS